MRCWPGCFTGGAAVEVGGGVVAHRQRLQAAVLLFKRRRERDLFLFPSPLVFSFFFLSLFRLPVVIPLSSRFCFKKTSLPGFKLPLTLSFLSLFHFSLWLVLSPPPFSFFFGPFPFCSLLSLLSVPCFLSSSFVISLPPPSFSFSSLLCAGVGGYLYGKRERGRPYCHPIAAPGE